MKLKTLIKNLEAELKKNPNADVSGSTGDVEIIIGLKNIDSFRIDKSIVIPD